MKKIMMTLAAVCVAATMNAQWYIGGGVGYSNEKVSFGGAESKVSTFKILPEIGYNLDDNWTVGTTIGYSYSKNDGVKTNGFEIAPYLRRNIVKWEKVNLFCDLGLNYQYLKQGDAKANSFGVGLFPGVAVNLNDKISFVTKIGALSYQHTKVKDGPKENDFNIGIDGADLSFGVYYNF